MASSSRVSLSALAGASSAALTSVASSICCIGPLAITLLGVNGAILGAAIKPYRPFLLTSALVLLAFSYWRFMGLRNEDGGGCLFDSGKTTAKNSVVDWRRNLDCGRNYWICRRSILAIGEIYEPYI